MEAGEVKKEEESLMIIIAPLLLLLLLLAAVPVTITIPRGAVVSSEEPRFCLLVLP